MIDKSYYINLRKKYIPSEIKIIFLLESPPISGKYFYDSTGSLKEPLFNEMVKTLKISCQNKEEGLTKFCDSGYLLVDATYSPVNDILNQQERNNKIMEDYENLKSDLNQLTNNRPIPIILIKSNIYDLLKDKLINDKFKIINDEVKIPFPSNGHQLEFRKKLNLLLIKLKFENILKTLTNMCFRGLTHYRIFRRLVELGYKNPKTIEGFEVFFEMSRYSHDYTYMGFLSILYDKHPQALSLLYFLNFSESNFGIFKNVTKEKFFESIVLDKEKLKKSEILIKNLTSIRDKYLFHKDKEYINDPEKVYKDYSITFIQIRGLYELAGEIINRYSVFYNESETHMGIIREEDIEYLFNFIDESKRKQKEDFLKKYQITE